MMRGTPTPARMAVRTFCMSPCTPVSSVQAACLEIAGCLQEAACRVLQHSHVDADDNGGATLTSQWWEVQAKGKTKDGQPVVIPHTP